MSAPAEPANTGPNQHCLDAPVVNTLERARYLMDRHAGHKYCAAFRTALEFSSEVLAG